MKIKLFVAAAATVMASTAMAQSAFEGFYAQAGIGYERATTSFTSGSVAGFGYTITGNTPDSFAGTIGAGYNFAVTPSFLLGIGAEYSPIAGSKGNFTLTVPGILSDTERNNKKDSYNIFISASIIIDKDKLAYTKVGYTGANISESDGDNTSLNGYSLGLGYKQIISGGLFGFGEVNYASYGKARVGSVSTGSFSATSTNVIVGLGYKF
jgi:opacity protein-like surface antigen